MSSAIVSENFCDKQGNSRLHVKSSALLSVLVSEKAFATARVMTHSRLMSSAIVS